MNEARFRALLRRIGSADSDVEGVAGKSLATLTQLYQHPSRHYHGSGHIEYCLQQLDLARSRIANPDAVELALWFHDAVYDMQGCDNEARSAELLTDLMAPVLPPALLSRLHALIMVTAHDAEPANDDEAYMHDIDLSVLARPWPEFRADSEAVRREKAHLDDAEFARRQSAFLHSLLARQAIYHTGFFRDRCEDAARTNIRRWLDVLAGHE